MEQPYSSVLTVAIDRQYVRTIHHCMEPSMRDLALQAAGTIAILTAIVHGAIAELKVFANARIEPRGARRLLRLIWQASTVDWIALGALLIAAPALGDS